MLADLHIHSCLSPCADDDMTPANICGMAHIKGLEAIAVTDHNTAENLPYVQEAADHYGLILLPGIEITTREEVHLLGYFPDVETAVRAGEAVMARLPAVKNRPDFFGHQYVMNTDDEIVSEEERLLIGATDMSLAECAELVRSFGGAAVPAHINRGSNGLLVNLGFMPEDVEFPVVEVSDALPLDGKAAAGRKCVRSSDAHRLGDILEAFNDVPTERFSRGGLLDALKQA